MTFTFKTLLCFAALRGDSSGSQEKQWWRGSPINPYEVLK